MVSPLRTGRLWMFRRYDLKPLALGSSSNFSRSFSLTKRFLATDGSNGDDMNPRVIRAAIVGSGPSGMYTAKYLRSSLSSVGVDASIDIIERLPTPFGLVRSGVAPDHPEVKNVEHDFERLFEEDKDDAGGDEGNEGTIAFRGNVRVGKDVSLEELQGLYDAVILAYGCEADRKLGIVGESDLTGVLSAREFVAWYNGHPDFVHIGEIVSDILKDGLENIHVVVIGQGNVALDCARVLAKGGNGLSETDVSSHALSVLGEGVGHVTVVGRRGHVQGAFTIKELRELTRLQQDGFGTRFSVREDDLNAGTTHSTTEELSGPGARPKVRIDKLLREAAAKSTSPEASGGSKKEVALRFLLRPAEFHPSQSDSTKIGSVVCERTKLEGPTGQQNAIGTGEYEVLPADLALISIGYKGVPLPGMTGIFDERRGVVNNIHGRVVTNSETPMPIKGLYVSGWLKRGPSGIIGTNIPDARDTVASIVADVKSLLLKHKAGANGMEEYGRNGLDSLLTSRKVRAVNWVAYQKIDKAEKGAGKNDGSSRPRVKITSVEEMMGLI